MTKRKRKPSDPVTIMPTGWDLGASGPANRHGMTTEARGEINPATGKHINPNGVRGARRIDNLEVWHNCYSAGKPNRAWITTAQFNAAVTIRNAYEATMRAPGTDYAKPKVDSSPKPDHAIDIQVARAAALHAALRHVRPTDLPLVWHCVIMGFAPSLFRHDGRLVYARLRFNDGMPALRAALDRAAQ